MNPFSYARPTDVAEAVREVGSDPSARFIAGGTNLIDLMKYNVERPTRLVDITRLPLTTIDKADGGGLRIGALVPNSDLAYDDQVQARYPLLSDAILAGASPMSWGRMVLATLAGSLPAALIYALTGATARNLDNVALVFGLVLGVAGLFWMVGRRLRSKEPVKPRA